MADGFANSIAGKQLLAEGDVTLEMTKRLAAVNKKYMAMLDRSNEWRKHFQSMVQAGFINLKQAETGLLLNELRITHIDKMAACIKPYITLVHDCPWANVDLDEYIDTFKTASDYVQQNYKNTKACLPYILRMQDERRKLEAAMDEFDACLIRVEELEKELKTTYSRWLN